MIKQYYKDPQGLVCCCDALEFLGQISSDKVDLVITDPPYGVRKKEDWDNEDNFRRCFEDWFAESMRVSKYGVIWFCSPWMLPFILMRSEQFYHRCLVWNKPPGSQFAGSSSNKIWFSIEMILVFMKSDLLKKKGTDSPFGYAFFDARPVPQKKYGHPTTKPLDLMKWLVEHYSDENDIILDPFVGTGTTAVAAKLLNRRFIVCDLNEGCCQVAKKRLEDCHG